MDSIPLYYSYCTVLILIRRECEWVEGWVEGEMGGEMGGGMSGGVSGGRGGGRFSTP